MTAKISNVILIIMSIISYGPRGITLLWDCIVMLYFLNCYSLKDNQLKKTYVTN